MKELAFVARVVAAGKDHRGNGEHHTVDFEIKVGKKPEWSSLHVTREMAQWFAQHLYEEVVFRVEARGGGGAEPAVSERQLTIGAKP